MSAVIASPKTAPAAAAVLDVEVASFDAWKTVFDGHGPARQRAGLLASRINRVVDSPNRVTLILEAPSFDALDAFLASRERADTMKRAGVVGSPSVAFVVPVEEKLVSGRLVAGALVRHHVADFGAWKAGFDARAAVRARAGIVGYGIGRAKDDPNQLFVYLQADSAEALARFMSSDDLKAAMVRGGVTDTPRITLLESYPFGQ